MLYECRFVCRPHALPCQALLPSRAANKLDEIESSTLVYKYPSPIPKEEG